MPISKRLRYEIFRRDNHACRYCGAAAPNVQLQIDHVLSVALGGTDQPGNLVTACRDCNSGKSATPAGAALIADVDQDAVRWAAAKRRAAEMIEADRESQRVVAGEVEYVFADTLVPSYRGGGTLYDYIPPDAFNTYDQLIRAGLALVDFEEAARIAAAAKSGRPQEAWRYFCGVCWKKVRQLEDRAAALLHAEEDRHPQSRDPMGQYAEHVNNALCAVVDGQSHA